MLSISRPLSGSACGNYYLKKTIDYYLGEHQRPGVWFGRGAELLQLSGNVQAAIFRRLLAGLSPDGKQSWVGKPTRGERQCGWDLTFSAPKSVSVLFALAPEEIRKKIERAHEKAVQEALRYAEWTILSTRRGHGGKSLERVASIFACFRHFTSRANDPLIHEHVILINLALRCDGTSGTVRTIELFKAKITLGAVYQTSLANELHQDLGLTIEPQKTGFHIAGVPQELCRAFSKRRQAIEERFTELETIDARSAEIAAIATRPNKRSLKRDELFSSWNAEAQLHGWGPQEVCQLLNRASKSHENQHFKEPANRTFDNHQVQRLDTARTFPLKWETAFPRAPKWSPVKNWKLPVLSRLGLEDRKRKARTKMWRHRRWGEILYRQKLPMGFEWRIQKRRIFRKAPKWNPARRLTVPVTRLCSKQREQSKRQEKTQTQQQR